MNDEGPACECVVDTHGLYGIALETSGNVKAILLSQLESGVICVPACVWNEFRDLYPEEAEELEPHIPTKVSLRKKAYTLKAAALAEKLNSGFTRGPYDENTDLHAAAIASVEGWTILTTAARAGVFKPLCKKVIDLETWLSD